MNLIKPHCPLFQVEHRKLPVKSRTRVYYHKPICMWLTAQQLPFGTKLNLFKGLPSLRLEKNYSMAKTNGICRRLPHSDIPNATIKVKALAVLRSGWDERRKSFWSRETFSLLILKACFASEKDRKADNNKRLLCNEEKIELSSCLKALGLKTESEIFYYAFAVIASAAHQPH